MRYRHLRRTFIASLAALAVVAVVVVLVARALGSTAVRAFLARQIEVALSSATGAEVSVGGLRIDVLESRLHFSDVRVEGAPISARARHVGVDVRGIRIARRLIEIESVHASGVELRVDEPSGAGPSGSRWVRFAVHRLTLDEVSLEGRRLPGDVDVSVGDLEGGWVTRDGAPRGYLRAGRLEVRVPGLRALRGRLEVRLELSDGLSFPTLELRSDGLRLDGSGRLTSSGFRLEGRGRLSLDELDRIVRAGGVLRGATDYRLEIDTSTEPFLSCDIADGRITAAGYPFQSVEGELTVSPRELRARLHSARLDGGSVSGRYELRSLAAPYPHWVRASLRGVNLEPLLARLGVPRIGVSGRSDTDVEMAWNGSRIREVVGSVEASVRPGVGAVPASGRVSCSASGEARMECRADTFRVGRTTIDVEGPVDLHTGKPRWSVEGRSESLRQLARLINGWVGESVVPEVIDGTAEVTGALAGTWVRPRVTARVDAGPVQVGPFRLDRVTGVVRADGPALTIDSCRVGVGGGAGTALGRARFGRNDRPGELDLRLSAADVAIEDVASDLGLPDAVRGTLAFSGTLHGPPHRPAGSFAVGLLGVRAGGLSLGDGDCRVELREGVMSVKGLRLTGGVHGGATWDLPAGRVKGAATWDDALLSPLGAVATKLAGQTGRVHADFDWRVGDLPTIRVDALAPLAVLQLRLGPDGGTFTADLEDVGSGEIRLTRGPDGQLTGRGEWQIRGVAALIERLLPERGLPVSGTARATMSVRLPPGGAPVIGGTVQRVDLTLDERPVRLLAPVPFVVDGDGVHLDGARIVVDDEEVFLRLRVQDGGELSGNLSGTFDALLLRLLIPRWQPSGRLTGVVELLGEVDEPRLEGIVEVRDGAFRIPASTESFRDIDGTVLFDGRTAELEGFELEVWGGRSAAAGEVRLVGREPVLDLRGAASGVSYEPLPGLDLTLNGEWWLHGAGEDLELGGDLVVRRGVLAHRGDLADVLVDWFGRRDGRAGGATPRLALHVEADHSVEARTPFAQLAASATLDIHGTPARPGVVGRVELEEGGEFELRGVRYELERGLLTFSDPTGVEPRLDFQAKTWVDIYTVTILVSGPPDHLVPTLYSDPPLDETDILSLLLLGTSEGGVEASRSAGGLLASNIVTSKINAVLERRAESILAVDQLRLDPFAESATGNPTARVTVVKQLSPKWTVILQSNVTSNREEVVLSRWYLRRGMFLEAMRDADGSYSLDLKYRRRY